MTANARDPQCAAAPGAPPSGLTPPERQARESLWLGHGHQGLYGDDGEMQCAACPADYKRQPLTDLIELAMAGVRAAYKELRERPARRLTPDMERGHGNASP